MCRKGMSTKYSPCSVYVINMCDDETDCVHAGITMQRAIGI